MATKPRFIAEPAPVSAGPTYVADSNTIQVPVFPTSDPAGNFAPPFVLPPDQWIVEFVVQQPGNQTFVFDSVTFDDSLQNVMIVENLSDQAGGVTWSAKLKNTVSSVNMLSCTVTLVSQDPLDSAFYRGDPTIAAVPDPMG